MHLSISSLSIICSVLCQNYIFSNANPLIGKDVKFAEPNEFPYIVSIGFNYKTTKNHRCGGSLITKKHVLTADHCFTNNKDEYYKPHQFIVRVGSNEYENGVPYELESFKTYDQYVEENGIQPVNDDNDIAVIKLKEEVNVPGVVPIKMTQEPNSFFIGKTVKTAGWGHALPADHSQDHLLELVTIRSISTPKSLRLRTVSLTVLTEDQCWDSDDEPEEGRICTGANPYNLLGQSDSGGPLVYENELIGVNEATLPQVENSVANGIEIYHRNDKNLHVGLEHYMQFINDMLLNC